MQLIMLSNCKSTLVCKKGGRLTNEGKHHLLLLHNYTSVWPRGNAESLQAYAYTKLNKAIYRLAACEVSLF